MQFRSSCAQWRLRSTDLMTFQKRFRRKLRSTLRHLREWRMIVKGLASTRHPVDAHIIPIRRCNLSCTYCNEFDSFSKPVATQEMLKRIDKLAALGTPIVPL